MGEVIERVKSDKNECRSGAMRAGMSMLLQVQKHKLENRGNFDMKRIATMAVIIGIIIGGIIKGVEMVQNGSIRDLTSTLMAADLDEHPIAPTDAD
jgi:hypothetical protein